MKTGRIAAAAILVGTLCMPTFGSVAQEKPAGAKKDPASAERSYAAGTKAYEAGNLSGAVQQLSAALSNGGLPNPQMAKALYYRGTAYRKQGKPAQAISDLTTAVWLKGGLSDSDRAQAMEQRQLAYSEAGLGSEAPAIGSAPLDAPAAKPVQQAQAPTGLAPAPPPPAPKPGVQVATVPPKSSFFSVPSISMPTMSMPSIFGGGTTSSPAPEAPAAAIAPAPAAVPESSWQTATAPADAAPASIPSAGFAVSEPAAPAAPPQAALAPTPQATESSAPSTLAATGSAITGFFGGIFGGGSGSSSPAPATPATTLATGSTGPTQGDTPWDGATVVAQTSSMVQRGPEEPPAPLPWTSGQTVAAVETISSQPARPAAQGGKYKLQVAAVRSREEAEKLAASLNGYQAVQTGAVQSEIDEAVIGNMGTFYRVKLGPYADAKEPGQLCKTLKPQGFDCMVVTQ